MRRHAPGARRRTYSSRRRHGAPTWGRRPAARAWPGRAQQRQTGARPAPDRRLGRGPSVASPIICRSALAIEAHRGVASLANTARYGQAMRLALRSDGCAQPTTSDR
ncbi:hypothetical protein [Verminephrobacter eiseniae]|uniref:hypothetical protein n=1 Tax=Verminephrobacter eiseniae TaxID=364317 RepID=UPI0022443265|nr:hypothetical protein [Verminephrobacter eiseniae]